MANIYVYCVDLPPGVDEMVAPCCDGDYTVYIDASLDDDHKVRAYAHALEHIRRNDWERTDVQEIETEAHSA